MKVLQSTGGLGSQMSAYATYLELVTKYPNEKVYYDTYFFDKKDEIIHNGEELTRLFGIEYTKIPYILKRILYSNNLIFKTIRYIGTRIGLLHYYFDETFCFNEKVFTLMGNYILYQCWTSEKYFINQEAKLKKIFTFPVIDCSDKENFEIMKLASTTNSVAIHIRRGDYIDNPILGGVIPLSYYKKAIKIMDEIIENPQYIIFSDDQEWVSNNLNIHNASFVNWNKGNNSYKDMQLMSMCKHNIIPNSSFSWWAAWLNPNRSKIVISPKTWSTKEGVLQNMNPENRNWIILPNYE
jgi:hypothetical protein